ncbi:hypothetical protein TKK_0008222 [Trichogramma kaykai]
MENTKLLKKKKVRLSRAQREKKKAQAIQNDLKKGLRILQPHEKLKFANMHHKDEAIKIKRAKLTLAENARRDAQRRNALERRKKLLPPNGAENTNSNINKSPTKQPKDLENQIPGSVSDNEVDDEGIDPFKRSSKLNRSIQDDSPTSSLKRVEAYADLSKEGGPVITKTEETPENSTSVAQQQEQEQHQPSPKLPDDPQIPNNQNIALINQRDPAVIIMAEQVKVKDAIATVPLFNGKNMNVEDFLETVTEAHDLIDQVKRPIFLKLVKLKIQGEARKSLKGATLNSVDELKKHLKQLYGTGLSLTALQGLLSRQIQQNGESVLTFANKIRDIGNEIIQKKEAEGALPPTFEASVKASQIECFKNGLIDEIALRLTNNDDISAIITEAVKIEKDLEIKRGAQTNLININLLPSNIKINEKEKVSIEGIDQKPKVSYGKIKLSIFGMNIMFHVVDDSFNLPGDALLGAQFFHDNNAIINFKDLSLQLNNDKLKIEILNKDLGLDLSGKNNITPAELIYDFYNEPDDFVSIQPENHIPEFHVCSLKFNELKNLISTEGLDETEKFHALKIINDHKDIFHLPGETLPGTDRIQHRIITTDDRPIHVKQYKYPHALKDEVNRQIQEMLNNDVIEKSESPYNNPLWIVQKKPDAQGNKRWRIVLDFRALNEKTIGDAYPLPNITEIFDQVGSAKYYSVLDLAWGFWQIKLDPKDAHKCAFSTPFGHYQYKRMAFGLKNAPSTFQRLMDSVLKGLQGNILFVYLDDIVIYSNSIEEHEKKFGLLANCLREAGLKLQPEKCKLLQRSVSYLGHILSENGLQVDSKKIEAVVNFPRPKTLKNVRQFIGLAGYYRRFIDKFASIAKPLFKLLQKETAFEWNDKVQNAFEVLKKCLTTAPVLVFPKLDQPYNITTDASGFAVGGVLSQGDIGKDRPIAYTSRALRGPELNYEVYEKEALAIIHSVRQFHSYIYNRKVTIYTDHQPLIWFRTADLNTRVQKWRFKLSEYDYTIVYKPGRINVNADCLSRNVPESQRDTAVCVVTRSTTEKTKILTDNSQTNITTSAETKSPPINEKGKPSKKLQKPKTPIPTRDKSKRQTKRTQRFDPSVYSKPPEPDPKSFKIPNSEPENSEESDEESQIEDEEEIKQIEETVIQEHSTDNSMVYSKTLMHCIDGNIAYFIDINGQPIDDGAKKLKEFNKLPKFSNISVGDASLFELSKRINHFALCIKDEKNIAPSTCKDNMKVALSKLRNLLEQRTIKMIFLTKSENILGLPWSEVITSIVEIFKQTDIKIVICTGKLTYIPEAKRDEIFDEMHNSAIGGHRGISKTYNRIKRLYYWENLKSDIQRRIQQCLNCQLKKLVRLKTRQPMIISDTPGVPFEKVALDIVGPMTKSKDGFEYILTIQDNFSKFCMAIPLIDISAISVMDAFIKRFVSVFGSPKVILTDQAYHPQSNGSLERSHHVLKEYLKQYSMSDDSWADWVELAILNYNTSVQESTKLTPYEIIFGRLADLPSAQPLRENDLHPTYQDYLKNLVSRLNGIQKIAYDNLVASKFKNKKYYDAKVNYKEFKPGDYVFLLSGSNSKKANQYQGPFKILEVLKSNNIRLQIKKKSKIVHANRIRISHIN